MIIAITSGKGGTGKTTAVSAIGACLAAMGKKTLCVDMDFALPNLDLALGMTDLPLLDLRDVTGGRCTLDEAVMAHPDIENLYLLSGLAGDRDGEFSRDSLKKVISEIDESFDYGLIDAPAGIGDGFYFSSLYADKALVLATLDASSMRDSQRVAMELDEIGVEDIHLIVNRVRPRIFRRVLTNVDDMIDFIGLPLIGLVPEDSDVLLASAKSKPLILMSDKKASKAFLRIARRITGEEVPLKFR